MNNYHAYKSATPEKKSPNTISKWFVARFEVHRGSYLVQNVRVFLLNNNIESFSTREQQ